MYIKLINYNNINYIYYSNECIGDIMERYTIREVGYVQQLMIINY